MRFLLGVFLALLAAAASAQERPILVGVAVPLSGQLHDLGAGYQRGLELWAEQANARGGVLGRRFELRIRDDLSSAIGEGALYEKLIDEDKADVLLGPVGSAATLLAMAVADQRKRVLVNATGVDSAVLKRGNRYTFQVPAAAQEYGADFWPLLLQAGVKRPLLVDKDDTGMTTRLREDAGKLGIAYAKADTGVTSDYAVLVEQARAQGVDAVLIAAPPGEAAEFVKAMKKAAFAPRVVIASSAAHPIFARAIGQDAEFAIGVMQYSPASRAPGNAAFVKAYRAKFKLAPDFFAACAYAAGVMLEAALRESGTLDQEKLREAFVRVRVDTPLGSHEAGKDGAQAGARPVLMQMQKGRREIVWPEAWATAKPVMPFPEWGSRVLLK